MATLKTNLIEPEGATTTLTIGESGGNVVIGADSIKNNVYKDSGGNTLFQSDGSGTLSNQNSAFKGNLILLTTQTPSGVASVSFTSGLDSTYDVYIFKFIDINPATNNGKLQFNGSIDGGSNYNVIKTTTMFTAHHNENDGTAALTYESGYDLAQSTADQVLGSNMSSEADASMAGEFYLFSPSSTTYVKHFYSCVNYLARPSSTIRGSNETFVAGYYNTTSAIDAVNFTMSNGNFDGTIKMYGLL